MSRTKRFKKDTWRIRESRVTQDLRRVPGTWCWEYFEVNEAEAKKRIARFHSDAKRHVMIWQGPGWFHNLFAQRPHRRRAKIELHKYSKDADYEVQISNKPPRPYWW